MKVLTVVGIHHTGKTTIVEKVTEELRKRGYRVGSVKEIHFEDFAIDTEGTNTHRHKMAGSQLVTARGLYETDILFQEKLSMDRILKFYDHDYVILEGVTDIKVPKIISATTEEEVLERLDENTIAISGKISNRLKEFKGLPVINPIENTKELVDLIEEKVEDYIKEPYNIKLQIGERDIEMVPFVKNILVNVVLGLVKELKGYEEGKDIKIHLSVNRE
ncbi:MAG: molybdopterin-guanine dinucleotide biosynthesis protein B [Tissierellia bacterium]|nr:molybdopterin-guanine dinucleotide biosynthesis protein B [Tissierellia bacterium]